MFVFVYGLKVYNEESGLERDDQKVLDVAVDSFIGIRNVDLIKDATSPCGLRYNFAQVYIDQRRAFPTLIKMGVKGNQD